MYKMTFWNKHPPILIPRSGLGLQRDQLNRMLGASAYSSKDSTSALFLYSLDYLLFIRFAVLILIHLQ